MKAEYYKSQVSRVLEMAATGESDVVKETGRLNPADYRDITWLEKERAMFRKLPIVVGHSSEIVKPGDFVVRQHMGRSWVLVRGKDGTARAFLNYCQHRGTKLMHDEQGNCKNRLVCSYHAWTYDATGALVGVPRADLFPGLDKSTKGLKQGSLQEKYGLLWLIENAEYSEQSIDEYLGDLSDEFAYRKIDKKHLYFDKTRTLNANWKFPLFAFLESYHLAVLHKESIGDFFMHNIALAEQVGPHVRSFVPRQNALELNDLDWAQANLSDYITPTNIIFPNICTIGHPTSMSVLSMFPGDTPNTSTWRHMLFVDEEPKTAKAKAHYDKTIAVLDEMTYAGEDFWVSEQAQEGIDAQAVDEIILSCNEHMLAVFDRLVKDYCD